MTSKDLKSLFIFLLILSWTFQLTAQNYTQSVRGQIVDRDNGHPLSGVGVQITGTDLQTLTDSNGTFRLSQVPAGRHTLEIRKEGFQPYVLPDMVVNAGKETVLDISLETL